MSDPAIDTIDVYVDLSDDNDTFNINISEESFNFDISEDKIAVDAIYLCDIGSGTSGSASSPTHIYDSDGTLAIDDIVYLSPTVNNYVLKVVDNNSINPAIGIVTLINNNEVTVAHSGFFDIPDIVDGGKKIFINQTGRFTSIVPNNNYIQVMGIATSNNSIYLNPMLERIKRL